MHGEKPHQSGENIVFVGGEDWRATEDQDGLRYVEREAGGVACEYCTCDPAGEEDGSAVEHPECYSPESVVAAIESGNETWNWDFWGAYMFCQMCIAKDAPTNAENTMGRTVLGVYG